MLQRSPTYVMPVPSRTAFANTAKRVLGDERGYAADPPQEHRQTACGLHVAARSTRRLPVGLIRRINAAKLPDGYPVDEHFSPSYNPWGSAAVRGARRRPVHGASATAARRWSPTASPRSPRPASCWSPAASCDADIIVTATGLNIQLFGGMSLHRGRRAGEPR